MRRWCYDHDMLNILFLLLSSVIHLWKTELHLGLCSLFHRTHWEKTPRCWRNLFYHHLLSPIIIYDAPTINEITEETLMLIIITSPFNIFIIRETSSLPSHEVFNPDPKVEQQWKKPEFSTLSVNMRTVFEINGWFQKYTGLYESDDDDNQLMTSRIYTGLYSNCSV